MDSILGTEFKKRQLIFFTVIFINELFCIKLFAYDPATYYFVSCLYLKYVDSKIFLNKRVIVICHAFFIIYI